MAPGSRPTPEGLLVRLLQPRGTQRRILGYPVPWVVGERA